MKFIVFLLLLCTYSATNALAANSINKRSKVKSFHETVKARQSTRILSHSTAVSGENPKSKVFNGEATFSASTFNLAKSVVGCGVLSLPSGVAFFSDDPRALIPSSIICAAFGLMAAYSFCTIGKVCEDTESKSFQEVWSKTVSEKSAKYVSASITALCFLASLAYSIIIGDSFTSLAQTFQLPPILNSRPNVILALSSLILYPLCSLRSLTALAPFSLLGLGGTLYTAIFMAIRYFDKSYAPNGKFFNTITTKPSFGARGPFVVNHLAFVLVSMLSTSYIAHYNAPKFYAELKDPSVPKFNAMVYTAFAISIAFFIFMMSIGFLTFGGASSGFVLNNYSGSDVLATIGRLAIGLALITGYPFTFSAFRDGVLDLAKIEGPKRSAAFRPLTVGLMALLTGLAILLKDVGFVVSISGAMFGCGLMFIVPMIMNISNIKKKAGSALSMKNKSEIALNIGMIFTGIVMTILGVAISVLKQIGKL